MGWAAWIPCSSITDNDGKFQQPGTELQALPSCRFRLYFKMKTVIFVEDIDDAAIPDKIRYVANGQDRPVRGSSQRTGQHRSIHIPADKHHMATIGHFRGFHKSETKFP
nr:hypothetical protein [Desulfosarcina alkanivorans]